MALKPITKYQRYDYEKDPHKLFPPDELARLSEYDKVFNAEYCYRPEWRIDRAQANRACKLIRDGMPAYKALRVVRQEARRASGEVLK